MQEYKIRIPNSEISKQVQDKAIQLGYPKNEYVYNNQNDEPLGYLYMYSNRIGWGSVSNDSYFQNHHLPEISYQDFLRIGEEKGLKVVINPSGDNQEILKKLLSLGYNWQSVTWRGTPYSNAYGLYLNPNKTITQTFVKDWFESHPFTEVSMHSILNTKDDNLTVLNTNTEIMSELTLKCSKEPKNAKNLTVGSEYVGILIDAEGDQVDSIKDAKFFMCTNNSGNEARYSISLFQEIVVQRPAPLRREAVARPVPPPPPPVITAPFENFINNTDDTVSVTLSNNGASINVDITVPREGVDPVNVSFVNHMQYYYSDISCGIGWVNGLNTFVPALKARLDGFNQNYYNGEIPELTIRQAITAILEYILQKVCENNTKSFLMLSTNDDVPVAVEAMDSLVGHTNISGVNVNSDNNIHVWVFKNRDVE